MKEQMYTIGEAAELLDVTPMTLRNWEKAGKLKTMRDENNGYRLYPSSVILKLKDQPVNETLPTTKPLDSRALRFIVRQLSKAYRDSLGGSLLERFEEISKLMFAKIYSEDTPRSSVFNTASKLPAEQAYELINELYADAQTLLPLSSVQSLKPDYQAVANCINILSQYEFKNIPTDIKGFIYEELIKNTFDKTDNQQFFTPRTIVQFMVGMSNVESQKNILDPACGSGGFLISALDKTDAETELIGLEIDPMMAWVSQMNLVMNGAKNIKIASLGGAGSLSHSEEINKLVPGNSIDLIITNPPFGSDFSDPLELSKFELGANKKNRRRGVLFIERCIEWLKPGGSLCIVIDDGVLNGEGNFDVRRLITDKTVVESVISLPESSFMPYATVKASILLLRKKKKASENQSQVFMAAAQNVGRKPNGDPLYSSEKNAKGEHILVNDLPRILEAWQYYRNSNELSAANEVSFIADFSSLDDSRRFDIPYHHPMRFAAQHAIKKSRYTTRKLGDLVTVRNISAVPALQDPDDRWRFIGLADISSYTGEYTAQDVIGSQLKSSVKHYKPGDILFSKMRPELQKCCYIQATDQEGYTSAENVVMAISDSDNPQVLPEYIALILRSELGMGQILHQITGVGRPRIGLKTLLSIDIPVPPLEDQLNIIKKHDEAWNKHVRLKERSEKLRSEASESISLFYSDTVDSLISR